MTAYREDNDVTKGAELYPGSSKPLIAHVSTTFNHRSGGIHRMFKRIAALRDAGYRTALVVGREFHPGAAWDLGGIELHRVNSMVKYLSPRKDLAAFRELVALFRRIRPEVVHTHLAKAGILGRWAASVCRVPVIIHTVHGPTFPSTLPRHRRVPFRMLEWAAGRVTDHFVFVGEELRGEYMRSGVCTPRNSVVIRTGRPDKEIDAVLSLSGDERGALRRSLLKNGEDVLIANVGRVVPSKQQDHAIRVVHELRQRGVGAHLAIVGEAFLEEEQGTMASLRGLAEGLGVADHITFTGHRDDVLRIMAASDAILHTSRYEGLPNILVEAGLAARPVVTYAVSGAREVIREGETGFVVDQGDIPAAAERLSFIAGHPSVAREMGERARSLVSGEYRESSMIRNKLAFYENILRSEANA